MASGAERVSTSELTAPSREPKATEGGAVVGPAAGDASPGVSTPPPVLKVRDLRTYFFTYDGIVRALDGVAFDLRRGETLGLVGETGCGKSVTSFSITRLIPDPPGRIVGGSILYKGVDLLASIPSEARIIPIRKTQRVKIRRSFRRIKLATEQMAAVRGREIAMIFQEPSQAMNPIFSISNQLGESILLHRGPEVIQGLLQATPTAPEVATATDELAGVATRYAAGTATAEELRAAARRLGEAVHLPTFATEAYYLARDARVWTRGGIGRVERALRRLSLTPFQRRYLEYRLAQARLWEQLKETYMQELRAGGRALGRRSRIRAAQLRLRLRYFYYGLWGIRKRVQRPLQDELFWRTVRLLESVSIANPVQIARSYPHELSGGMLQRVMIAMAISPEPAVLIADEPTTALDVTIQAQILDLVNDLKNRLSTAILLITHDLAVIAEVADRVCVMYAGQIVETAPVKELFQRPLHPYTQGLLASVPRFDQPTKDLSSIPGSVPNLITPPTGCRFHPRCPHAMPVCKEKRPPVTVEGPDHTVACYLYTGPVAPL